MGDLERRLTDGLTGVAGRRPHPGDLAAAARERLRRRRRTTATTVAAALAMVAIPVGLTLLGVGDDGGPDRRDTTVAEAVPGDWRVESWRDLTLRVPPTWARGGGTGWCAGGGEVGESPPEVSRPGGVVAAIGCPSAYGHGAHFLAPSGGELPPGTEGVVQQYRGDRYPEGSWIGYASTGRAAVWVATPSRELTRQVLDSTEAVSGTDPNGCPTRLEPPTYRESPRVSVCRYSGDGWLEQSELLSAAQSRDAVAAISSAPWGGRGVGCEPGTTRRVPVVVMRGAGQHAQVAWSGPCAGVDVGADEMPLRELTEDVLYWALSPGWSGAVGPGVPLPGRLREQ